MVTSDVLADSQPTLTPINRRVGSDMDGYRHATAVVSEVRRDRSLECMRCGATLRRSAWCIPCASELLPRVAAYLTGIQAGA